MKVLELFAGTRSIGKAFEAAGHEVYSVEWDKSFEKIDLYADILNVTADDILREFGHPDVIWASPDCATFSIAAISHHRRKNPVTGDLDPVSDYAKFCDKVDQHVLDLIRELRPTYWFVENPRGGLRKMEWMQGLPRYTVTYCQYELDKPTEERRRLKDQSRDPERERERWRQYYAAHREERIEAARQRRRENPGLAAADNAYYRRKRKLMAEGVQV